MEIKFVLLAVCFCGGCLSITTAWECMGNLSGCVCEMLYREAEMAPTIEWAWRLIKHSRRRRIMRKDGAAIMS